MNNLSIVIDTAEPATPRELGERLGVSVVQVVKTLVRNGVFLRLDETMDATTVLTVAAQLKRTDRIKIWSKLGQKGAALLNFPGCRSIWQIDVQEF